MSRVALPLLLILAFPSVSPQPSAAALAQEERAGFHAVIDPVIDALWTGFDQPTAFEHVQFISQFWRLPGNHGYDVSIDRIRERLTSAGFAPGAAGFAPGAAGLAPRPAGGVAPGAVVAAAGAAGGTSMSSIKPAS